MNNDEATLLLTGITAVLQALSMIPKESRNRTQEDEEALTALAAAYHGTNEYYDF